MESEDGKSFVGGELVHHFPKRRPSDSLCRTYEVNHRLPEASLVLGCAKVRRHEATGTAGMNVSQGTLWSKEPDGKELHRAGWWRVRSGAERILFFLHISPGDNAIFPSIY